MTGRGAARRLIGGGVLGIVLVLGLAAWGGWKYVTHVPPYRPRVSPAPSPNGYRLALAAVRQPAFRKSEFNPANQALGGASHIDHLAELRRVRGALDGVRAALRYRWQSLPSAETVPWPDDACLVTSADALSLEAERRWRGGAADAAFDCALDALELGARDASILGPVITVASNCHERGIDAAEVLALQQSTRHIPAALARVRRIRDEWPSLRQLVDGYADDDQASYTALFQSVAARSPAELLGWSLGPRMADAQKPSVVALVWPRRRSLAALSRYYAEWRLQAAFPPRRRRSVPAPSDPWIQEWGVQMVSLPPEKRKTDLALLETALAARMERCVRGRYPDSLQSIDRRWLPRVPLDAWDQPVIYRLRRGEPLIYSVGPDGRDDGGRAVRFSLDPGLRGDIVFGRLSAYHWSYPGGPVSFGHRL